jgi:hypothetical protein
MMSLIQLLLAPMCGVCRIFSPYVDLQPRIVRKLIEVDLRSLRRL